MIPSSELGNFQSAITSTELLKFLAIKSLKIVWIILSKITSSCKQVSDLIWLSLMMLVLSWTEWPIFSYFWQTRVSMSSSMTLMTWGPKLVCSSNPEIKQNQIIKKRFRTKLLKQTGYINESLNFPVSSDLKPLLINSWNQWRTNKEQDVLLCSV